MGEEDALPPPAMDADGGMPESPRKAAATVLFSWEHEQGTTKQALNNRGVRKSHTPTRRRLSVPPPPGRPSTRGFSRAVRPEDDPFLAAYLVCTKSTGGRRDDGRKKRTTGAWAGLGLGLGGLSCRRGDGTVVQSVVRLAKLPKLDPRDDD